MTGREAFEIWAPAGARWVEWVRPVPFVAMQNTPGPPLGPGLSVPGVQYLAQRQQNAAIIVDMPGVDGVREGVALARMGYRPIPLYNGTNAQQGAMPLVDNHAVEGALQWGALALEKMELPPDAPPAFLLDSNRLHRYRMDASAFDNSWDIYHQDLPPAETFLQNGIGSIVVRGDAVQKDLSKILFGFGQKGLAILYTDGYAQPKAVRIRRPLRKNN